MKLFRYFSSPSNACIALQPKPIFLTPHKLLVGQVVTVSGIITSGADLGSVASKITSAASALYPGEDWAEWTFEPNQG